MNLLKKTLAAAALFCAPLGVHANPVDLAAEGYSATGTVFNFGPADTQVFGTTFSAFETTNFGIVSALNATDVSTYFINLGGATIDDQLISTSGGINSNFGPTPLEMIFTNVSGTGSFAAIDGEDVLLSLLDPNLNFVDGYFGATTGYTVTVLEALAPIPLPAGGLLLLSAGGAMVMLRRRSKT